MKHIKRLFFMLAVLIVAWILLSSAAAFPEVKLDHFPLIDNNNLLIADENTRVITFVTQDPYTRMITATVQIQHNSLIGQQLAVGTFAMEISFDGRVAPYNYDPLSYGFDQERLYFGKSVNGFENGVVIFNKYCNTLYKTEDGAFDMLGAMYINNSPGVGGLLSAKLSSGDFMTMKTMDIDPGQSIDVIEFYFMPVNGLDMLDLDMFGFDYALDGLFRSTNFIATGIYYVQAVAYEMMDNNYYYIESPGTFKMHIQRPKPNVTADFTTREIVGYNPAAMEWSYDGVVYYGGYPPVIYEAFTIYVRYKGDVDYSGDSLYYGDYKKFIASEPTILFFDSNVDPKFYIVTFNGNGGTPNQQTRYVAEGFAIEAGDMPTVQWNDHIFIEWNTEQDGTGTIFTATTIVDRDTQVYAQWVDSPKTSVEVTFDPNTTDINVKGPTPSSITVILDDTYGDLAEISRDGFIFDGWYCDAACSGDAVTDATIVANASDHILFAKWIPEPSNGYKIYDWNFEPAPINVSLTIGSTAQFYALYDKTMVTTGIKWVIAESMLATVNTNGLVSINKNKYTGQVTLMLYSSENQLLDSITLRII
ncbi:MAG: InlB B-repeat-containing protein [Oscillospiraceae bacterium]|nr:InlB B-repeat-containing protein [Oscillospiraceae bacterium]MCL2153335.1 InlB B-repeat-containing protein [Oscillospiraceae bacterium]